MPACFFVNSLNLSQALILMRVRRLDPLAIVQVRYDHDDDGSSVCAVMIDAAADYASLDAAMNTGATGAELQQVSDYLNAVANFGNLPNWATWTPADVDTNVGGILSGYSKAQANSWIDTTVVDLPTARTALKTLAGAVIDLRVVAANLAKAVLFIRDLIMHLRP